GPSQGDPLAPGATCTFFVTFQPGAVQTYAATVSIVDDAPYSPHQVPLTGDGSNPAVQPPRAPSGLSIRKVSLTQVDLRWSDNSGSERAFTVYRWHPGTPETPAPIATLAPNMTAYSDRGVVADEQYAYYVRASSSGGISAPCKQIFVITPPPLAPT